MCLEGSVFIHFTSHLFGKPKTEYTGHQGHK